MLPPPVMNFVLILFCCIYFFHSVSADEELDSLWQTFKMKYNKTYTGEEDTIRKKYFEDSLKVIAQHNLEADLGKHTFRLAINQFADMSPEEMKHHGCLIPHNPQVHTTHPNLNTTPDLPKAVDWRDKNMVTHVRNQGSCGSCWAIAATGALEALIARQTGQLVPLSVQNLVDCSGQFGGNGCQGTSLTVPFDYIVQNEGIDAEDFYPYSGQEGECKFSKEHIGGTCKDYVFIHGSEDDVLKAVATIGPVASSIDASLYDLKYYGNGIYSSEACDGNGENHGVLIVGYGEENGTDYWIVKNSWGPEWGMDGYMHIKRNAPSMCGIAKLAAYPIA